ncbi:MAG: hypothetical protein BGO13_06080 [Burkholderiales bacterium 66-5]|nr:MAG: hypothetical protein BGO13_06080 [Burkholderiales bacterium 66-5]
MITTTGHGSATARLSPRAIAAAVLIAGLGATAALVRHQESVNLEVQQVRLQAIVDTLVDDIEQRVKAYAGIAASVRDVIAARPDLPAWMFRSIVDGHAVADTFPEVRSVAFTRMVPDQDLARYTDYLRQLHPLLSETTTLAIHPQLPGEHHYIIEQFWPFKDAGQLVGMDTLSQPDNMAAILRTTGTPSLVLSAPFDLLQGGQDRKAFVLRYAVHPSQPAPARAPYIGSTVVTVSTRGLLHATRTASGRDQVFLRIEDVTTGTPVLLASDAATPQAVQQPFAAQTPLLMGGRRWRVSALPAVSLLSSAERSLPWWIGSAGAGLSLLLAFAACRMLQRRRQSLLELTSARATLRQREIMLKRIFEQNILGVAVVDMTSGKIVEANARFAEILGYDSRQLAGRPYWSWRHDPDTVQEAQQEFQALHNGGAASIRTDKRLRHRDGSEVWIDLTISPLAEQGETPNQALCIAQDITARRQMARKLQRNEARQRSVLNHLPIAILLLKPGGEIEYRNEAFVRITGYTREETPTADAWLAMAIPDAGMRERISADWNVRVLQAMAGDGLIEEREYVIRRANGESRTITASGVIAAGREMILIDDITDSKQAQTEIQYLASHDPLTGAANRGTLMRALQEALRVSERAGTAGMVLMLDLDGFKTINETAGHQAGDEVLRQAAARMWAMLRSGDTVARHGDDTFVLVMETETSQEPASRHHAAEVGQHLLDALARPCDIGGQALHTSACMGIALFMGTRESADELLKQADMALHQAKQAGPGSLRMYSQVEHEKLQKRANLVRDLRAAIEQQQFELYYQPQIRAAAVIGAEALVRWHHPRDGFVSPAQFIPLAEETGLIVQLGEWVLGSACRTLARWSTDPLLRDIQLAVNVSPRQFYQEQFIGTVLAALSTSGADARRLELELTEGLLLQDVEGTITKMDELRGYGVSFSLDDFGTGYSSLAYLKRLPLDKLKIDQSFVRDVLVDDNDAAIARTIVSLGNTLGLATIAEGVETEAQKRFLLHNGCDTWQGYLFSRPLPAADFERFVHAQKRAA